MDDNRVRNLGLIGGGSALLIALGVAALGGPDKPAADAPAPTQTTVQAAPSVGAVAQIPSPAVETAMADDAPNRPVSIPQTPQNPVAGAQGEALNPNLEFIVRFDDRHPLSRAQALYLQGKRADAEASARETMARRTELAGLCFQRFTFGAEVVMAHCARVPRAQVKRTSDRWVRRLRTMPGVQYVDPNVIVSPEAQRP